MYVSFSATIELSGERFGKPTLSDPDHPDFWRRVAPSAARPLQRVLGSSYEVVMDFPPPTTSVIL
jgi:hypothetical protein